jgi:hypothetical protein
VIRLYLFAEGPTEQTFAHQTLGPHLATRGVYLQRPVCIAHRKDKGKVHRGGGRKYLPMRNDIARFLKQEKSREVFFTTMIDLYEICPDCPGFDEAHGLPPRMRVEFLERRWAEDIGDERFLPFIQLHEFEACLFADPSCFSLIYDDSDKQIAALTKIAASCDSPEEIDDGQETAPSKRIIAEFPDYEGVKATFGPQLAGAIGLDAIRAKCPHFSAWLVRLESLGSKP